MNKTFLTMAVAVACIASAGTASAEDTRTLENRVKQLEAKLAAVQTQQEAAWLNERRAEEIKTLIREVLSDADTRASLMEDGMTAGHDGKKFFLRSADGGFLLNIEGQIQFRYTANFRDGDGEEGVGETALDGGEAGFELRRTKLRFSGHIAGPKIGYVIQLEVGRGDNVTDGDIIMVDYDLTDNITLYAGEVKGPFLREELTSSKHQLAADRTLVNELFTLDSVQGVGVTYSSDMFRVNVMIHDGSRSGDGDGANEFHSLASLGFSDEEDGDPFDDGEVSKKFSEDDNDFAIAARVDVKIFGDWSQQKDFTSWTGEDMALFIGGAIDWEVAETGSTGLNDSIFLWTIDAQFEMNGLNVFAAFVMAHTDNEAASGPDVDPLGFVIQGAYNFEFNGQNIEPFVRYEFIDLDAPGGVAFEDEVGLITVGGNWYLKKHAAKVTVDVVFALDSLDALGVAQTSGFSNPGGGLGLLPDAPDEDGQVVIRAQFQLLF